MQTILLFIEKSLPAREVIFYTLHLTGINKGVTFVTVDSKELAQLKITRDSQSDLPLSVAFYQLLELYDIDAIRTKANGGYFFESQNGKHDLLASVFYLVNCLQEFGSVPLDKYGRFDSSASLQLRLGLLEKNLVQELINELYSTSPVLNKISAINKKSTLFLTHDIDYLFKAKNEDGNFLLRNYKWDRIPKLLYNHFIGKPDWCNVEEILKIEKEFGYTSCFYWLVFKDSQNADYEISSEEAQLQINFILQNGGEVGLHKSLRDVNFSEELSLLTTPATGQRFHFLKFNLPIAWQEIENSGLKLDASLGFSQHHGFRNSYGLPFQPYNFEKKCANVFSSTS